MSYQLIEHMVVGGAVVAAALYATAKWWPAKKAAGGCGTGCAGCGSGGACGTPAEHREQPVAMPVSRRAPR